MNKLDGIIAQEYGCENIDEVLHDFDISPTMIKQCMLKAMKMILEEAADTKVIGVYSNESFNRLESDKQSITSVINKYYENP